jgi:hypothetical protein
MGLPSGAAEVPLKPGVRSRDVSLPAVTGCPVGRCTIGPAPSGIREGLIGALSLAHRALATLCDGPGT